MTLRLFGDLKPAGALEEWSAPSQGGGGAEFPAVRPTRNGSPSSSFPTSGLGPIIIVPAGTAWSAWEPLTAGEAAACVLAGVNCRPYHRESRPLHIQLGTGTDPSSSIIAEFYDHPAGPSVDVAVSYTAQFDTNGITLPAATALAARVRATITATADKNQVGLAVAAMPLPLGFTPDWDEEAYRQGVTQVKRAPDIGSTISLTTGAVDEWGDWAELIASASGHQLVQGIEVPSSGAAPPPYSAISVRVGIGPSSDNVVPHEVVSFPRGATTVAPAGYYRFPRPVEVLAGDRVWLAAKAGKAAQPVSAAAILHYLSF